MDPWNPINDSRLKVRDHVEKIETSIRQHREGLVSTQEMCNYIVNEAVLCTNALAHLGACYYGGHREKQS